MEGHCLLLCSSPHAQLLFLYSAGLFAQGWYHPQWTRSSYSKYQSRHSLTCPQAHWMEAVLQRRFPSPTWLYVVLSWQQKLTRTIPSAENILKWWIIDRWFMHWSRQHSRTHHWDRQKDKALKELSGSPCAYQVMISGKWSNQNKSLGLQGYRDLCHSLGRLPMAVSRLWIISGWKYYSFIDYVLPERVTQTQDKWYKKKMSKKPHKTQIEKSHRCIHQMLYACLYETTDTPLFLNCKTF